MNSLLAQSLKEAGFPQKKGKGCYIDKGLINWPKTKIYVPTLSELIEVCGDIVLWKSDVWHAGDVKGKEIGGTHIDDYWYEQGTGSTPEEAVARLWLELNKKLCE